MRLPSGDTQHLIVYPLGHGGRRPGSGRKPQGEVAGASHARRPQVDCQLPVHVTLKRVPDLPSFRAKEARAVVEAALTAHKERAVPCHGSFRLVQYSILPDHLHLVVEADDTSTLSRVIGSLKSCIARNLNSLWSRTGKPWADRFHMVVIHCAKQAWNVLVYVLHNAVRHGLVRRGTIDPCSSGPSFPWSRGAPPDVVQDTVAEAKSDLLRRSWKYCGEIVPDEISQAMSAARQKRHQ